MHKLRTVDVWDTLLRRKGHPDFSKLSSARALSLIQPERLILPFKDHWTIFRERCAIEGELASESPKGIGEYELNDVLERLLDRVLLSPGSIESKALAKCLAELELQFELRHTYPDPWFREFSLAYPAQRSLFLSDFYMSGEAIQRLLRHHGLDRLVESGISSCDVGLNKRSGTLFTHVHSKFNVMANEHVHIGDNAHADVAMPRKLGIEALHFLPEDEHRKRQERSAYFHNRQALFEHVLQEVWSDAQKEAQVLPANAGSAYLLGIRAAPLFVGFALHIAEQALTDGVERLFFFTREGEFFIRVWGCLFPDNRLAGLALPEAELLEVSRIATFCASLQDISCTELMRLWNLFPTQSIFALLKTLGLEPEQFAEICKDHDLKLDEGVVYPWRDERVIALIQDPRFRASLEAKIKNDRSLLLDYLDQHHWPATLAKVGVVDIGWRGTIQDNLAIVRPSAELHGYYMGLQRFLNPQPENCKKSAFGVNANESAKHSNLLDAVSPIEMICNSASGSVSGYARELTGSVSAIRTVDTTENAVHLDFVVHFQAGVLRASQAWADYIDSHVICSAELRETACATWHELVAKPPEDLAQAYASLSHNEVFGVGAFVDKSAVHTIQTLFAGVFSRGKRQEVILYIRQTQWVGGMLRRKDLTPIHKSLLVVALLLGRGYKRLSYWWRYR